jgi:GTP-binding protein
MKITSVDFVTSAVLESQYPETDIPEILLVGRSNVGKSSFINSVLNRKNVAYTSSKPGKTQTLNFFLINELFHFVDVPGYGYAKVSKKERESFGVMIEDYLLNREQLSLVFMIVDIRHEPSKNDIIMYNFLSSYSIPTIIIGTKLDKITKNQRFQKEKIILDAFQITKNQFIPYSSETKENIDVVYDILNQVIGG